MVWARFMKEISDTINASIYEANIKILARKLEKDKVNFVNQVS